MPKALITGITGQDGFYLTKYLLNRGYEVHGIRRRTSLSNAWRLRRLKKTTKLVLHYGDMTDLSSLIQVMQKVQPDEVYNLAAQAHVQCSFTCPESTGDVNGLGALRVFEAVRLSCPDARIFHASSSEMFGDIGVTLANEKTPFNPVSPYGCAKLYAHNMAIAYRKMYGMFICTGIMFNHESPLRGEDFVTRKITRAVSRIFCNLQNVLYLGNLHAVRDWGHAADFVRAQHLMMTSESPKDYILATGITHNVRTLCYVAFKRVGICISWEGSGEDEKGIIRRLDTNRPFLSHLKEGDVVVRVDPQYLRPAEIGFLHGDATQAKHQLGWEPETTFMELVNEMVDTDVLLSSREKNGYKETVYNAV